MSTIQDLSIEIKLAKINSISLTKMAKNAIVTCRFYSV